MNVVGWIGGLLQTGLYCDFFYYYAKSTWAVVIIYIRCYLRWLSYSILHVVLCFAVLLTTVPGMLLAMRGGHA